jgi:hypothetical protein
MFVFWAIKMHLTGENVAIGVAQVHQQRSYTKIKYLDSGFTSVALCRYKINSFYTSTDWH